MRWVSRLLDVRAGIPHLTQPLRPQGRRGAIRGNIIQPHRIIPLTPPGTKGLQIMRQVFEPGWNTGALRRHVVPLGLAGMLGALLLPIAAGQAEEAETPPA